MANSWGTSWANSWGTSWGAGVLGPMPIGTVPVRYIIGDTANVVPVETVMIWAIGVVRVRQFVGPANVVPVREATSETPRVKVMKV